jgi:hypothetical protein
MTRHWNLTITPETVRYIIALAHRFDVKDVVTEPDPGSNAADDDMRSVLEDHSDDAVGAIMVRAIRDLNQDEQIDLVALTWLGRGDSGFETWHDLRAEAARDYNPRTTVRYLMETPLLADYLTEALAQFGRGAEPPP